MAVRLLFTSFVLQSPLQSHCSFAPSRNELENWS
ncbi:hypothetical protein M3J09_005149 [Ascochyta lentis]